jgi:hypothetical protein
MSERETSLGQVAYDAFVALVLDCVGHNFMPPWGALPHEKREAWRAAADAVREAGEVRHVEQRRLTFTRDTTVTAIEVAPLGPKGVVPTLHAKTGDVLVCSPDGGEVYVQRGDVRAHEVVAHYVDDGRGVLRPVMS